MRDETPTRLARSHHLAPAPGTGWWLAAAACAIASFFFWLADVLGGLLVVLGGTVLPGRVPVQALAFGGLALGALGVGRRRWPGARRVVTSGKPVLSKLDKTVPAPVRKLLVICALLLSVLVQGAHLLYASNTTELTPAAPRGCLIVAGESTFLRAGGGSIYQAGGSWGLAREIATFATDNGAQPFAAGAYRLAWDGEVGRLDQLEGVVLASARERMELQLHCS
ncbi:hypothetical protein LWF15_32435 [Kineosporia rhizophila]|uniref:hypothetical protein n=1 Tax=Kineosporia TaxID=49184 RepID=UPI001E658B81|nr:MULTISPECIES: hypothetical protein [Kineosporia]MCE0540212.1 hypothetical protein [Kineosporia rhizophila]GLY17237.1 hypothetical protein Kisp01_42520 [Kineosporia sp. NBRC 101677]